MILTMVFCVRKRGSRLLLAAKRRFMGSTIITRTDRRVEDWF